MRNILNENILLPDVAFVVNFLEMNFSVHFSGFCCVIRHFFLHFFQSILSGGADNQLIIYDISGGGWRTTDSEMEYQSADTT